MGRPLPNYDIYIDKLKNYLSACEIKLEYRDVPSDGVYIPARRLIQIDKDLPESTEIAIILHEAGHTLDDTLYTKAKSIAISRAYNAVYDKTPTQKQMKLVLEVEERAWMYGRSIAKKLRIPLGKWFDKEEAEALKDYRATETQNR